MKLSWRDAVTALLVAGGGTLVWAKFYNYSWALIGSWRNAVAALAVGAIAMFAFSSFDFANRSWLNLFEMLLGVAAIVMAIVGVIVVSEPLFYIFAATLGVLWVTDFGRHVGHSLFDTDATYHHHAPAH